MTSFYYKVIPVRSGLTGYEMVAGFLDAEYPGVKFDSLISDGIADFGILSGESDILAKAMATIEGRFSAARLTESSFIGVVAKYYNPVAESISGIAPLTLNEYLTANGIAPPADSLVNIKDNKKQLLKEITKKKFSDDNDLIADLCKCVTLLNLHYSTLSSGDKTVVDNLTTTLKTIYNKDMCIEALTTMVNGLSTILSTYYTTKTAIDAAVDSDAVDAIVLS